MAFLSSFIGFQQNFLASDPPSTTTRTTSRQDGFGIFQWLTWRYTRKTVPLWGKLQVIVD